MVKFFLREFDVSKRLRKLVGIIVIGGLAVFGWQLLSVPGAHDETPRVSFNEQIRPIFNSKCVGCHGGVTKQGGISYIFREEAIKRGNSGRLNVVPGKPGRSELVARIKTDDPLHGMPLGKPKLSNNEIATIERWISEGANWEDHWSFLPPVAIDIPARSLADWGDNPIDRFLGDKIAAAGLVNSPRATIAQQLRRLTLDLTGLPPTVDELKFISDENYLEAVDRLLASPRFGEKWATLWLDAARYTDSMGYVRDFPRDSWPYRDWVINAYNNNLPYDQFVTLQLAGDLVEGAGLDGLIATSFHRQTPTNLEGGSDNEEYRMVAVMDRVATTWSVLNGVTMACVQCHSHPYDPIDHSDYYQSLSFFNGTADYDTVTDSPTIKIPFESGLRNVAYQYFIEKKTLIKQYLNDVSNDTLASVWSDVELLSATVDRAAGWRRRYQLASAAVEAVALDISDADRKKYQRFADEALDQVGLSSDSVTVAGRVSRASVVFPDETPAVAVYQLKMSPVSAVTAIRILVEPLNRDKAAHTPEAGFAVEEFTLHSFASDGTRAEIPLAAILVDNDDNVEQQLTNVFARAAHEGDIVSGFSAEKIHSSRSVVLIPATPITVEKGGSLFVNLTQAQLMRPRQPAPVLRSLSVQTSVNSQWQNWVKSNKQLVVVEQLLGLNNQLKALDGANLPIMQELSAPQKLATLLFERGDMLAKTGQRLVGGVPNIFQQSGLAAPNNRLEFAEWFFSDQQPLTARVEVNRIWQSLFGRGLVETQEDFGSSGTAPSHPALLDWLAVEFQQRLNWDRKALIKLIVSSDAYRQSSVCAEKSRNYDAQNLLLSCMPRKRLSAEMVRDQALQASGLLNHKLGGKPVMPWQPEGIWNAKNSTGVWELSERGDQFRRAIYTHFKQSAPYPSFLIFDHVNRDVSSVRRLPTNTPLQALVMLNDPVYVEAGSGLADKMRASVEAGAPLLQAFDNAALRTFSRRLGEEEQASLRRLYDGVVETTGNSQQALQAVAMTLLNSDEAINR